jgi:predicted ester cyclase
MHHDRRTLLKLGITSLGTLAAARCVPRSALRDDARGRTNVDAVRSEQTKADARRFYEHLNRALKTGNIAELDAVIAPGAVDHNPVPGMKQGLEGIKAAFAEGRVSFPDLVFTVEDVIAEGDKAACRLSARATHRGTFQGVPATGKVVTQTGIDILRFVDGRLVERWGEFDALGLLAQLGLVPR